MNKFLMALLVLGTSVAAHADISVRLSDFNTNDCSTLTQEYNDLSNGNVSVATSCEGPGSFLSSNGSYYQYRMNTYLTVYGYDSYPGLSFQLSDYNTDNCQTVLKRYNELSNSQVQINATCSAPGVFLSSNGTPYTYRVYTTVTFNY